MKLFLSLLLLTSISLLAENILLRDSTKYYDKSLEELLNIETEVKAQVGTRSDSRDIEQALSPIDVITAEQIDQTGYTELGKVLQRFVPGFNFPRASIAGGSEHSRPFTLRGLNSDQVLVLINGKRYHNSAHLHTTGNIGRGTTGVDLNTIPLRSIERIEILRDGAAAQYGSDAIAGIINIILKGYGLENRITATFGTTPEGDGNLKQTDLFYSYPLKYEGFVNVTAEVKDREETNRAGLDTRDDPNGIMTSRDGDPKERDYLLALNAEIPTDALNTYYATGIFNYRKGESASSFRRLADNPVLYSQVYPNGFLPLITPTILSNSITLGVKGIVGDNIKWDLSHTVGYSSYHYYVEDSINDSMGPTSPTSFDAGEVQFRQHVTSLDLTKKYKKLTVASGIEWRYEDYSIDSGEYASYALEGPLGGSSGSIGFSGFNPHDAVNANRQNYAAYLDLTYRYNNRFTIGSALRYEKYSDFGETLNGKLLLAYRATPNLLFRGSGSTGFRAPSLSQSYYSHTYLQRTGPNTRREGTLNVYSPAAIALGAKDLKAEESTHATIGLVYQPSSDTSFTLDYFYTKIDNRIMLSGLIRSSLVTPDVQAILNSYGVDNVSFFTNAIDTETNGIDLRIKHKLKLENGTKIKLTAAYNYTETTIISIHDTLGALGPNNDDLVVNSYEQQMIENGQPKESIKLYSHYKYRDYEGLLNLNKYGSFNNEYEGIVNNFGAMWTVDAELSLHATKAITFSVGGHNILNTYPDKWGDVGSDVAGGDKIIQYSSYSPTGYNGAFYYMRLAITF